MPQPEGRGLFDGVKGRQVSKADQRWRRDTELRLVAAGMSAELAKATRLEVEEHLLTLSSALDAVHQTRSLGNVADPVEEIIFMILSRQAPISKARVVLDALVSRPGGLDGLRQVDVEMLSKLIRPVGIQNRRARQILAALDHIEEHHGLTLMHASLVNLHDDSLLSVLELIPGLDRKTALCVMLYSFGRDVLPVDTHTARLLRRTGVLEPLGIDLEGLDTKKVQLAIEEAIPPSLRGALHVNAVHHGQTLCREGRPLCDACPVRLLCATGRDIIARAHHAENQLTLVDMFCGAGGLSDGFRRAGYRTVLAVDADSHAMRTYRLNHPEVSPEAMLCRDMRGFRDEAELIRGIIGETQIDVLVGGPPCQGFSRAGLRAKTAHGAPDASEDERNHLYRELVDLLQVLKPRAMVMENVPGMGEVHYENGGTFVEAARKAMEDAGYSTATWLLNAAAYGVAQDRIRRIIVGVREGEAPQLPPPPTHRAGTGFHRVDSLSEDLKLPEAITLGERLSDLPPLEAGQGLNIASMGGRLITGHVARFNNEDDLSRFREIGEGESYRKLVARRPDLKCYGDDSFPDKFFKMPAARPARTIVAHLQRDGNGFIHPHQVRSITPREAARLQSFDDDYLFTGPFTKVYRQIGNAVPPLLAEAIGRHLRTHLETQNRDTAGG